MTTKTPLLFALLAMGCFPGETGINRTVVNGTVHIAPGQFDEGETNPGSNDLWADDGKGVAPTDIGYISYRYTVVNGVTSSFGTNLDQEITGDMDYYSFSPLVGGTITMALLWEDNDPDSGDTGEEVDQLFRHYITVLDLANTDEKGIPTVIGTADTAGYYGEFSMSFDVESGGTYAIGIGGVKNKSDQESGDYTLLLDGFDPNDTRFVIGAYQSDDITARGNPVGGASVASFELPDMSDEANVDLSLVDQLTWSGAYTAYYMREVIASTDTASPLPSYNEHLDSAWLFAGNFANLNAGLASGVLYSSTPLSINFKANQTLDDQDVTIDTIQPKTYGWTFAETEPNELIMTDGEIDPASADAANYAGDISGPGLVDVLTGTLAFADGDTDDLFSFTITEDCYISVTSAWDDPNADLDYYVMGPFDGDPLVIYDYADDWYANPEVGTTEDIAHAGETWYLWVNGYAGEANTNYTIELEWSAP